MRLKGGKLLLDFSNVDLSDGDINYPLSDEEYKTIREKGLVVYLNYSGDKFILPLYIMGIDEGAYEFNGFISLTDSIQYDIKINADREFTIEQH